MDSFPVAVFISLFVRVYPPLVTTVGEVVLLRIASTVDFLSIGRVKSVRFSVEGVFVRNTIASPSLVIAKFASAFRRDLFVSVSAKSE